MKAFRTTQGAGFAMLQIIGQCGPLIGTRLYPDSDAPFYTFGMTGCTGAMVGVAVLATVLRLRLASMNRRAALRADEAASKGSVFVYML